jgi:hypothetical protein
MSTYLGPNSLSSLPAQVFLCTPITCTTISSKNKLLIYREDKTNACQTGDVCYNTHRNRSRDRLRLEQAKIYPSREDTRVLLREQRLPDGRRVVMEKPEPEKSALIFYLPFCYTYLVNGYANGYFADKPPQGDEVGRVSPN